MNTKREVVCTLQGTANVWEFYDGSDWLTVIIYARPKHNVVALEGSYGGYAYLWSDPGCSIFKFLARCDRGYLTNKFTGGDSAFDEARTAQFIRESIIGQRRRRECEKDVARAEWELAHDLEVGNTDFAHWMEDSVLFYNDYEMAITGPGPRAHQFHGMYDKFWSKVSEVLRAHDESLSGKEEHARKD